MNVKSIFYTVLPGIILMTGCEEYMDIKYNNEDNKRLVVEGAITTEMTSHSIVLSRSGDFFEKGPRVMETGANVTISDGSTVFPLNESDSGVYVTDYDIQGQIGHTYTLHVELADGSTYTASETITKLPEIDSILFKPGKGFNPVTGAIEEGYYVMYYGPEPKGPGDHYLWSLYLDDTLYTDTLYENVFSDDEFVDGNYIKDFELFFIRGNDITGDIADVELVMYSISREYYEYLVGLLLETVWKGSPWDGPPANSVSNISNGALGYFRASDRKTKSAKLVKTKLE
jgi:hypothetical protein